MEEKRNFLQRIWGKICWWFKWEVLGFPDHVENYGLSYALQKIFIRWWWYDLKYGVLNLIKWFPVIWQDRNWDYHFWIRINIKKLEEMEKLLRNHGNHLYAERDADNIRKAVLALKRLEADDYILTVNKYVDEKYGDLEMNSIPCKWDDDGKPTLYSCEFTTSKEGELTEQQKKLGNFLRSKNYRHADYLKKQDLEYATKIINKYLFHWWD